MRLCIGVCSHRDHPAVFTESLVHLVMRLTTGQEKGIQAVGFRLRPGSSLLPKARQEILNTALAEDFTHLLFLDDDMTFPPDTVGRLAAHGKRIVGVNAVRKRQTVCLHTAVGMTGDLLDSRDRTGLEEVLRMGLGVVLIDLDAVRNIPPPHFEGGWSPEVSDYTGEDYGFCRALIAAGEQIYIDHDLSRDIGHIGQAVYSHRYYDNLKDQS
jgi:hypothetical protein